MSQPATNVVEISQVISNKPPLPDGWQWVRLGDLCDFIRGVSFDKGEVKTSPILGHIPILRAGNIGKKLDTSNDLIWLPSHNVSQEQRFREKDIAVCMSSGSASVVGKTAQLKEPFEGSVGAFCGIIRARSVEHADYLAYWLRSPSYEGWRGRQTRGANIQNLRFSEFASILLPLPPPSELNRITTILKKQMAAVERARAAAEAQLKASKQFINAVLKESLNSPLTKQMPLHLCINEVTKGIGESWSNFPVLGATRAGLAPAKEGIGKNPQRYKPVTTGTIFYNPMRILLGSIAMIDEDDEEGITSPDYVVFRCNEDVLHTRWFYNWLRSPYGEDFIKSMSRGAVRERMLFKRLAAAEINIPSWEAQLVAAKKLRAVAPFRIEVSVQLETINKLPTALLRQAFTGKL